MPNQIDQQDSLPAVICRRIDGAVIRAAGEGEQQTRFELSFSSEEPVRSWYGEEVLVHTAEAVSLDRLRTTGTLLFAHGFDPNIGRIPLGGIEKVDLDKTKRRCTATIVFDEEDEVAMGIARKVAKGYLTGVSVRAEVKEWTILEKGQKDASGRFSGPMRLATKWTPVEISIEPTPGDTTVGVGRSIYDNQPNQQNEEDVPMPNIVRSTSAAAAPAIPAAPPAPAAPASAVPEIGEVQRAAVPAGADVVAAERQRAADIIERCAQFGLSDRAGDFVARNLTIEQASDEILRHLNTTRDAVPGVVSVQVDEMDKFRAAASDSIVMRGGLVVAQPAEGAKDLRGIRLRDLAVDCLARSGVGGAHRMSDADLFRSVLSPDSAFVGILGDSVHKSMATAYNVADTTHQLWTSVGSNPDFKPKHIIQISEAGDLLEVTQNGELKMDHPGDNKVASVLATFGRSFGFTRQALINDDIDMLSKIPAAYVRAAKRGVNKAVYKILRDNPAMADGQQLFSAAHKNLGTGAKPSTASYQEAMGKMMHQRGLRNMEALNVRPRFVICDPLQYADHATMLHSIADPDKDNSGRINPFKGIMELIMDADLFDTTTTPLPYFFAADPASCGTIEVTYLNGVEEPILDWEITPGYLGIKYTIIHDRGVTLIDHRGLFKNPGL